MVKLTCLLVLVVVVLVCAEAIRIDPVQPDSSRRGKYFPVTKKNDPRCKNGNAMLPDPKDCTRYIKCVNGESQEKKCPEDFKFDSIRHCIPPDDNPDCGKKRLSAPVNAAEKCPESYGIFPVKSDCHKYMVCNDGIPTIRTCPENYVYRDANGACIEGNKCPDQASEGSVCKKANQLLPDELNCRRYIKCVNFQPLKKECPPGTAFDPKKHRCTKDQLEQCKNNDIMNVGQDE